MLERNSPTVSADVVSEEITSQQAMKNIVANTEFQELTQLSLEKLEEDFRKISEILNTLFLERVLFWENQISRKPLNTQFIAKEGLNEQSISQRNLEVVDVMISDSEKNIQNLQKKSPPVMVQNFKTQLDAQESFISTLGHDFNTPFTSIVGYATFISEGNEEEGDKKEIINAVKQLRGILNSRMLLAKKPDHKKYMLSEIAHSDIEQVKSRASLKNIDLQINFDSQEVYSDEVRMNAFLSNFINNAIKFTPEGGKITVSSEVLEDGYVKVSVRDTGGGVPKQTLEEFKKMFAGKCDPEKSHSHEGTNGEKGTGKGIRNCIELAQQIGAKLEVESEAGKGSEFSFIVPAKKELHEKRIEEDVQDSVTNILQEKESIVVPDFITLGEFYILKEHAPEVWVRLAQKYLEKNGIMPDITRADVQFINNTSMNEWERLSRGSSRVSQKELDASIQKVEQILSKY